MHQANCLNCETTLLGSEKYCPECGQKSETHRFTWSHFFHEMWHAMTHTDKGLLNLLKGLATKPGFTVSEFVGGKLKKYFNPVTFLFLCLGLLVVANSLLKPIEFPQPDPSMVATMNEKQKAYFNTLMSRSEFAFKWQEKHPNILALVGFPLQALLFWLFFRKRNRNYVEILIAVIFIGGFANLLNTIVFTPLLSLTKGGPAYVWFLVLSLLTMLFYISWGMKGFLQNPEPVHPIKVFLVTFLYFLMWTALTTVFFLWFVLRENTLPTLKKMVTDFLT